MANALVRSHEGQRHPKAMATVLASRVAKFESLVNSTPFIQTLHPLVQLKQWESECVSASVSESECG